MRVVTSVFKQKRLDTARRILNRTVVIESFKRWLWFVDIQWDKRRMVESNLKNMSEPEHPPLQPPPL